MLGSVFVFPNSSFGNQTASFSGLPIFTRLGDVQVLVGGVAAPVLYASPGQINFQVPAATPTGGLELQVVSASTGQVLASWLFRVDAASPGSFTTDGSGSGQLLALNQDGSINKGSHPAKAGTYLSLFGTGVGICERNALGWRRRFNWTHDCAEPEVFINSDFVPGSNIEFSGFAPDFVGLWQINVKVPANMPPGEVIVYLTYDGINSILDPNLIRRTTTIRTTP